jgi:hypothetical protein
MECSIRRHLLKGEKDFPQIGTRATKAELECVEKWCDIHYFPLLTEKDWKDRFEKVLDEGELKDSQKRHTRSCLIRFLTDIKTAGYVLPESLEKKLDSSVTFLNRRYPPLVVDLRGWQESKPKKQHSRQIALSFQPEDYLEEYRQKYPDATDEQRLKLIKIELARIKKSWEEIVRYSLTQGVTQGTLDYMSPFLFRLLGYYYEQNKDLESVSLEVLIPVISTQIDFDDYDNYSDYYLNKGKAEASANKSAKNLIKFLINFIDNYSPHVGRESKKGYADALIFVAKYLYREITDTLLYKKYEDIAIITALKAYKCGLPKDPPRDKTIPLTLTQVWQILEVQKMYADDQREYSKSAKHSKIQTKKRKSRNIAIDMQRLIVLCFLSAIPPLRARTLAKLRIGKTLKYGLFRDGVFIPKDKMKDPSQALYYFDMKDIDYKTGKTYGDYCTAIPNYKFKDGSSFYDYLNSWIDTWRQHLLKHGQKHNYLFVYLEEGREEDTETETVKHHLAGDPISPTGFECICRGIMKRFTGAEIRPHIFRSICRTHYATIGASKQVMDALAHFMQHSSSIADGNYDRRTSQQRAQPIIDFLS